MCVESLLIIGCVTICSAVDIRLLGVETKVSTEGSSFDGSPAAHVCSFVSENRIKLPMHKLYMSTEMFILAYVTFITRLRT